MTKTVSRYSVLLGDIGLQMYGWGVVYPVRLVSSYIIISYIGGGGGIEPHARVVAQGLTPYCDHIVTVDRGR